MPIQIINLFVRGVTQLGRLALILLLAKFLSPEELGIFGLFFVLVNYGAMLAGLDIYSVANREVIGAKPAARERILSSQLFVYCCAYVLVVPASAWLFITEILPSTLFPLFALLLISEHLSYEGYRLLNATGRPTSANLCALLRGAAWVPLVIFLFMIDKSFQVLPTVLLIWLAGSAASVLFCVSALRKNGIIITSFRIDSEWIRTSLKAAVPFIVGTLAIRSIFTFDRFVIEAINGLTITGVYTFYFGIAATILSLLEASIFNFHYPRLIAYIDNKDYRNYFSRLRLLFYQTFFGAFSVAVGIISLSPYLLKIVNKPVYTDYLEILALLLVAFSVYSLSMVPHYGLFAFRSDKSLMYSQVFGVIVFVSSGCIFYYNSAGICTVPYALIAAFSAIFLAKTGLLVLKINLLRQQDV